MKRYPLLSFLLLGFLLSWIVWVPITLAAMGQISLPLSPRQAQSYGAYGPALAAILIALILARTAGLQAMFSRLLIWRVGARWYFAALLLPAALSLLTSALNLIQGGMLPNFSRPPICDVSLPTFYTHWSPWAMLLPVFLQNIIFGTSLGEELAWRGFALPRLQQKFGPLKASVFIALLWVLWEMPLASISLLSGASWTYIPMLILGAIPAALVITWLFNNTHGSLLLVLLFNTATKMTDLFVTPPMADPIVFVTAYWLLALSILSLGGTKAFQSHESPAPITAPATADLNPPLDQGQPLQKLS